MEFFEKLRENSLRTLLEEHGGLIRVLDLLEPKRAQEALEELKSLRSSDWELSLGD